MVAVDILVPRGTPLNEKRLFDVIAYMQCTIVCPVDHSLDIHSRAGEIVFEYLSHPEAQIARPNELMMLQLLKQLL